MVKDADAPYEPNKRRWVKLKREHLGSGLADTVDLVVLGAYMGRGAYGGQQSVWLLGAHDPATGKWRTVAKVGNGMTDEDTRRLNATLPMRRVRGADDVPSWLDVCTPLRPDFVIADPWAAPVWEVTSCEMTKSAVHTAGVSLRFPRLTRERSDKTPREAPTVDELARLIDASQRGLSAGDSGEGSSGSSGESGGGASLDSPTLFSGLEARTPATLEQLGVTLPAAAESGVGYGGAAAAASVPA
jgi:DNA ligase-3